VQQTNNQGKTHVYKQLGHSSVAQELLTIEVEHENSDSTTF